MKKYTLIAILFFSTITLYSQVDKLRVTYELTFQIDSTNTSNLETERMILNIDKSISSYQSERKYLKDSILKSNNPHSVYGLSKSQFKYEIYKNKNTNKINTLYDYAAYMFEIEEVTPKLKWAIHKERKKILELNCIKATTSFAGRDYIAWFTNEIPISDGPYKFTGLPGLIMEISDTKNHYKHTAIGISYQNKNITFSNEEFTKISKSDFNDFLKKIKEKPSLVLYNPGIQIPKAGLDKYDRNHRERQKHENNPIELKDNDE
ncbi:MAG: GLPGLI family protein [Lutibacter sp.]